METNKNGEAYLIEDRQQLYLTIRELDNMYGNEDNIPEEDTLMADLLYGDNEEEKKKYFQKICAYKKYARICEHGITKGEDSELDMIKILEEEMKLASCGENEVVDTDLFLKGLYIQTKGEDFVRKARAMVDSKIARNRKDVVKYSSPELKPTFDDLSRKLGATPDAIKLVMLRSNDGELSRIVDSIKSGEPKISWQKLDQATTHLRIIRLSEKERQEETRKIEENARRILGDSRKTDDIDVDDRM